MDYDDIPNNSNALNLDPPEEQVKEIQAEKGEVLASAPLINSLLSWFDQEIALTSSIDGLDMESQIELKAQLLARQLLKQKLEHAKSRLEIQKDSFIPNI